MNDETFKSQIAFMAKIFGHKIDDDILRVYWNIFKTWPDEKFCHTCTNMIKNFIPTSAVPFPLPAHILQASNESGEHRARSAVRAVIEAGKRIGSYKSVSFGDPALHATIERFGGWPEICLWDTDKWNYNEKSFIGCYQSAIQDGTGPDHCIGTCEYENGKRSLSGKQSEIANKSTQIRNFNWAGFEPGTKIENKSTMAVTLLDDLTDLHVKKFA
jgi:hypothetical protein